MLTAAQDLAIDEAHPVRQALTLDRVACSTYAQWFDRGVQMADAGDVLAIDVTDTAVIAVVRSASMPGGYAVDLAVDASGDVQAGCDCPVRERHRILWCKHRIAVALLLLGRPPLPRGADAGVALPFASGRDPRNVPVPWTVVATDGKVRHITRSQGRDRTPACGQVGQFFPATSDRPLCRRCLAKHRTDR